jgi:biotin/methionine sulfoxide reductase
MWTATARHADIVFPSTTSLEREDFAWGTSELCATPMHQALAPYEAARDDYAVFSGLAARLGIEASFTEGKTPPQWPEEIWATTVDRAAATGVELPGFQVFWGGGPYTPPLESVPEIEFNLEKFHADPKGAALPTPSGKVEIFSTTLESFALNDCRGYPAWHPKEEFIGSERSKTYPLALNSNQPVGKLHSQYDFGRTSRNAKVKGRERAHMNPTDAQTRGIADGDIVRVFNDRGATLAAALITDRVRPGVVVLPTGAWYDPLDPAEPLSLDVHGNPNVLTRDVGTSTLSQGTSAHSALVDVERFDQPLPPIKAFELPPMAERSS